MGATGDESVRRPILRLEGAYWTVVYDGRLVQLQDLKGVRYLGDWRSACPQSLTVTPKTRNEGRSVMRNVSLSALTFMLSLALSRGALATGTTSPGKTSVHVSVTGAPFNL